ncbi:hypothetical protein OAU76_00210 [bacterium]|nr:hypothetical protein [bacterium]
MKRLLLALMITSPLSHADLAYKDLGSGWRAMTEQSDPFDASITRIRQISKDSFVLTCNNLNWKERSDVYFAGHSFDADIKYIIDGSSPVDKKGLKSTYLGGSDMATDDRYYSFRFNETDLFALKKGRVLKVAGKTSSFGWHTTTLDLAGLEAAYDQMCK